jgi:hypothetical protein
MKTCQQCGKHYNIKPSAYEESKYCSRKCQISYYNSHRKNVDLVGKKFNRLTVLYLEGRNKKRSLLWNCLCECGKSKLATTRDLIHSEIKSCGCLRSPSFKQSFERAKKKFFEKIEVNSNACHIWKGNIDLAGYGYFGYAGSHHKKVHRFSWEIHRGEIPKGLWVLHHCDNRACCNIDHLYLGTAKDNARDMYARKRREEVKYRRGSKSNLSKLTESDVAEIRKMRSEGHIYKEIAARFNVKIGCISHIITGRNWKEKKDQNDA